ncbi:GDSL-type esterase/lipase family protein [Hymenobacter sp. YC55]|uniref:SGNH/GDSL hydrolase family protein n=1 Tax=Hymenobacter sp. YC55 TaxID=3034019 RepID=UPI0023F67F04|nr:GDSL-type esterase/lipase family protein [Hymenobacter sp. YC55]MDF7813340.1 GDSL-type esterase/lipase family protein [Hymenobacter sp. YC55]
MVRALLLLLWIGASCAKPANDPQPYTTPPTGPATGTTNTFLSLGDSYTIGEGVPEADRWSVQLARLAKPEGVAAPDIIAHTGWTTSELQAAIQASGNQKTYSLVSLLIGVNNQYRGLPVANYRLEFRQLLQKAIQFAGNRPGRVLVLSIPDWGRSPYALGYDQAKISQEIDQFNAVAQAECRQAGIAYVDITGITRSAGNDATQYTSDKLHYSGKHMQQWSLQALPVVQGMLR